MENRVNCGYEIVTAIKTGKGTELVIGHNPKAPSPYVCWYCYDGTSYSTGDYCGTYKQALESVADRIKSNLFFSDFGNID